MRGKVDWTVFKFVPLRNLTAKLFQQSKCKIKLLVGCRGSNPMLSCNSSIVQSYFYNREDCGGKPVVHNVRFVTGSIDSTIFVGTKRKAETEADAAGISVNLIWI